MRRSQRGPCDGTGPSHPSPRSVSRASAGPARGVLRSGRSARGRRPDRARVGGRPRSAHSSTQPRPPLRRGPPISAVYSATVPLGTTVWPDHVFWGDSRAVASFQVSKSAQSRVPWRGRIVGLPRGGAYRAVPIGWRRWPLRGLLSRRVRRRVLATVTDPAHRHMAEAQNEKKVEVRRCSKETRHTRRSGGRKIPSLIIGSATARAR